MIKCDQCNNINYHENIDHKKISDAIEIGDLDIEVDESCKFKIYMKKFIVNDNKDIAMITEDGGFLPIQYNFLTSIIKPMIDPIISMGKKISGGYIMVDCDTIEKGENHRRTGAHIDGEWIGGMWHTCNRISYEKIDQKPQIMLLTSNYPLCKIYKGEWSGIVGAGGDCSEIDKSNMIEQILEPNKIYMADPLSLIHESIPSLEKITRILVRIHLIEK